MTQNVPLSTLTYLLAWAMDAGSPHIGEVILSNMRMRCGEIEAVRLGSEKRKKQHTPSPICMGQDVHGCWDIYVNLKRTLKCEVQDWPNTQLYKKVWLG